MWCARERRSGYVSATSPGAGGVCSQKTEVVEDPDAPGRPPADPLVDPGTGPRTPQTTALSLAQHYN
jgi:hypothetical protein